MAGGSGAGGGVMSSRPAAAGAVIAFVGSEASGKSTMLAETRRHVGHDVADVRMVHAGKPPASPLTRLPNLLLPALRAIAPGQRSTRVDARHVELGDEDGLTRPPLLFAVRAVMLAHDRRRLLRGAHAAARRGAVVLCDRYPSSVVGAPDSPQLGRWADAVAGQRFLSWLVRLETRMYADIPPAHVVFHLSAPLDVTLRRNREREKTEPEELVTLRHRQAATMRFDGSPVHHLDTTRPLSRSLHDVRSVVSATLGGPGPVRAARTASRASDVGKLRSHRQAAEPRRP